MNLMRPGTVVAACAGLLIVGTPAGATGAGAASLPAVTLAGSVGTLPASTAQVTVSVSMPSVYNSDGVPTRFDEPVVASETIPAGDFQVPVLDSATLTQAETVGNGTVNFLVYVYSGSQFTSQMVPVTLTAAGANGNVQAAAQAAAPTTNATVSMDSFRSFSPMTSAMTTAAASTAPSGQAAPAVPGCAFVQYGSLNEDTTRIGEVHVTGLSGVTMRWTYNTQADTELSVGLSTSGPTGPWSVDGNYTASNSMGTSGGYTATAGTRIYSDGHMWYERLVGGGLCVGQWMTQVVQAVGDSFEGSNSPAANPYGSCKPGASPFGYATIASNGGFWESDRAAAKSYSVDASLWGFDFGGHTGFTNTIHHAYTNNNSSSTTNICGGDSGLMPNSKVLYSGGV